MKGGLGGYLPTSWVRYKVTEASPLWEGHLQGVGEGRNRGRDTSEVVCGDCVWTTIKEKCTFSYCPIGSAPLVWRYNEY